MVNPNHRQYSQEELDFIVHLNRKGYTKYNIAKALGRTYSSVAQKMAAMQASGAFSAPRTKPAEKPAKPARPREYDPAMTVQSSTGVTLARVPCLEKPLP